MEAIDLLRKAHARNAGRRIGLRPEQPRSMVGQNRAAFSESDVLALPQDMRRWSPLQDPETGQLYFMANVDALDGGNPIR